MLASTWRLTRDELHLTWIAPRGARGSSGGLFVWLGKEVAVDFAEAIKVLCGDVLPALAVTTPPKEGEQDRRLALGPKHAEALGMLLAYVEAKCAHEGCTNEARTRVYWPGRAPARMCEAHAEAALRVATCMGFPLHVDKVQ